METAIYLSNERLQVVKGGIAGKKLLVHDLLNAELSEGAVINGVITDFQAVQEVAEKLKELGVSKARLVIDSGLVLVKNAVVPKLTPKQLMVFTVNELSGFGSSYEDLIYDYSVIAPPAEKGGGGTILCCGAELKLIASYQELFQSVGTKLLSVDFSINAACKLTTMLPEFVGRTYILSVLDGSNMVSMLFEENQYVFSSRFRLFSERGTSAMAGELSEKVSSLIQFNKSQRSPHAIETAYFCGMREEEASICEQISEQYGIGSSILPNSQAVSPAAQIAESFRLSDTLFAVGSLIRK